MYIFGCGIYIFSLMMPATYVSIKASSYTSIYGQDDQLTSGGWAHHLLKLDRIKVKYFICLVLGRRKRVLHEPIFFILRPSSILKNLNVFNTHSTKYAVEVQETHAISIESLTISARGT